MICLCSVQRDALAIIGMKNVKSLGTNWRVHVFNVLQHLASLRNVRKQSRWPENTLALCVYT